MLFFSGSKISAENDHLFQFRVTKIKISKLPLYFERVLNPLFCDFSTRYYNLILVYW